MGIEVSRICICDGYVQARIRTRDGYVPARIRTKDGYVLVTDLRCTCDGYVPVTALQTVEASRPAYWSTIGLLSAYNWPAISVRSAFGVRCL